MIKNINSIKSYSNSIVATNKNFSTKISVQNQSIFGNQIQKRFSNTFFYFVNGERVIKTTPISLYPLLTFLKSHTEASFSQLRDITAIDHAERKQRFEVLYFLLSLNYNRTFSSYKGNNILHNQNKQMPQRICMSVSISEGASLPSVTSIFPSAGWYERETWDRYGIFFRNHPDLRRRLTDYGFKGHPLRKDFPLTGYVEVRYDDLQKRILYEGVSLAQEYRIFTLENPWKK